MIQAGQSARLLDGKKTAARMREETAAGVARFVEGGRKPPRLEVILVGDDPASRTYVRSKEKACARAGIEAAVHRLGAEASQEELLALIHRLNASGDVDGILVQMPLPGQMSPAPAIEALDPDKDVDGFHPVNIGRLWSGREGFVPCTPSGIITLLESENIVVEGSRAVIIGRSDIVGRPMAALLMHRNATVTVCHSRTRDLPSVASQADILVAAMGRTGFVTSEFIKPGATVIDVGINQVTGLEEASRLFDGDPSRLDQVRRKGYTLAGDVHPAQAARRAGALTPVPGGVGPLTVAALLGNTLRAAQRRRGAS